MSTNAHTCKIIPISKGVEKKDKVAGESQNASAMHSLNELYHILDTSVLRDFMEIDRLLIEHFNK